MARAKDSDQVHLKRERAGRYVTTDGRFAVEGESAGSWYVIDAQRQNELGLPLMEGPFATLDAARAEVAVMQSGRGRPGADPSKTATGGSPARSEPSTDRGRPS